MGRMEVILLTLSWMGRKGKMVYNKLPGHSGPPRSPSRALSSGVSVSEASGVVGDLQGLWRADPAGREVHFTWGNKMHPACKLPRSPTEGTEVLHVQST